MENTTVIIQQQSVQSFQSSIRKMEKAMTQMKIKGANTSVISKRLQAMQIGLAVLESVWNQATLIFEKEELFTAYKDLSDLLPTIELVYDNSKPKSPQKTLLERRIKSIQLAMQAIEEVVQNM